MSAAACKKVLCCTVNQLASAATGIILNDWFVRVDSPVAGIEDRPNDMATLEKAFDEIDKATRAHQRAQKHLLSLIQ